MNPTNELYQSLLKAYFHFNKKLFDAQLPEVIFTVQRQKGVLGYFAPERWSSVDGEHCHEIAINPAHLGQCRIIEVLQTLVHEMAHCWQFCYGKPGRGSYHNKEWANKMIHIGLQPTSTGFPGGNIVGQQMSDYPIEGGLFLQACETLIVNNTFSIPWIDRLQTPQSLIHDNSAQTTTDVIYGHHVNVEDESEDRVTADQASPDDLSIKELMAMTYSELLPEDTFLPVAQTSRSKSTYQCLACRNKVWGKPEMKIICANCDQAFVAIS